MDGRNALTRDFVSLQNGPPHKCVTSVASVSVLSSDWTFGIGQATRCNQTSSQALPYSFGPGLLLQRYDGVPLSSPAVPFASLLILPASYNQAKKLATSVFGSNDRTMNRSSHLLKYDTKRIHRRVCAASLTLTWFLSSLWTFIL